MNKKKILISIAIAAFLSTSVTTFAFNSNYYNHKETFRMDASIDNQLQLDDLSKDLQKMKIQKANFLEKMVNNGRISREQRKSEVKKMDVVLQNMKNCNYRDLSPAFLSEKDGILDIDKNSFQKEDVDEYYRQMNGLRKNTINRMISNGTLRRDQGDSINRCYDNSNAYSSLNTPFVSVQSNNSLYVSGAQPLASILLYDYQNNLISTSSADEYGNIALTVSYYGSYTVTQKVNEFESAHSPVVTVANNDSSINVPNISEDGNVINISGAQPYASILLYDYQNNLISTFSADAYGNATATAPYYGSYSITQKIYGVESLHSNIITTTNTSLSAPVATINGNSITITGTTAYATITIYDNSGNSISQISSDAYGSASISISDAGSYYVTQCVNNIESVHSNIVTISQTSHKWFKTWNNFRN